MIIEITREDSETSRRQWVFSTLVQDSGSNLTIAVRLDTFTVEQRPTRRHKWGAVEVYMDRNRGVTDDCRQAFGCKNIPKPEIPQDVISEAERRIQNRVEIKVT